MITLQRSRLNEGYASLFHERADRLAQPLDDTAKRSDREVVIVRVGRERVGIPTEALWGLFDNVKLTAVPETPDWVAGLAQVRGEIVCVMRFAHWLGARSTTTSQVVAVLNDARGLLGLLVDEVLGFLDVGDDRVSEELTAEAKLRHRPFSAVTKDHLFILDLQLFLSDPRLIVEGSDAIRSAEAWGSPFL